MLTETEKKMKAGLEISSTNKERPVKCKRFDIHDSTDTEINVFLFDKIFVVALIHESNKEIFIFYKKK